MAGNGLSGARQLLSHSQNENYFTGLHDAPRFDALVKRIGIPD